ncbi:MAG: hypothetical protein AB7J40_03220 [Candidatus Altimarinota bacterium]
MAPTKKEIIEVAQLFNQGFEQIFLPILKEEMRVLRAEINNHVDGLSSQISEANENTGFYFQKCATKEEVEALENRVKKLELSRA